MHISEWAFPRIWDWLDNTISRKGLNAHQAAFANKKYKSHQRVGLPSEIIESLSAKDTIKTL